MRQISPIKNRILQYIDYKNISKYKFYRETGITRGVLDKESGISEENIAKFIAYSDDINLNWLLTGKGEMLKGGYNVHDKEKYVVEPIQSYQKSREVLKDIQGIPLYEIEASAGLTIFFNNQNTQIPLDYISVPNAPKCDGALFVRGDSMYPLLKAGDIICYKTISNIKNILWGEMYILDIDSGDDQFLTIKYVQKSDLGNDFVKLVSENRHHQPKDEPIKNIRALAMVKLSIRYNAIS